MPKGRGTRFGLALVGGLLLATLPAAQDARVVAANSSNGRILELRFDPPGSSVLNTDAPQRVGLQSLVFRDDGASGVHLLAADCQAGQVVFYANAAGSGTVILDAASPSHPPYPDGLSLNAHDDLFGTTSASGAGANKDARVWVLRRDPACSGVCLAGGYAPAVGTIDDHVQVTVPIGGVPTALTIELIEETRVVPFDAGIFDGGDLLVLASDPPALLRYPAAQVAAFLDQMALAQTPAELAPEVVLFPSTASVAPERRFPEGAEPNGMDFTPQGNLLVASGNGAILVFRPDGTRLSNGAGFVDFATNLGQGKFKLAVGPQGGVFRAFVSDRNGGEVLRFRIQADSTGLLDGLVSDPEFPVGIATTTEQRRPDARRTGRHDPADEPHAHHDRERRGRRRDGRLGGPVRGPARARGQPARRAAAAPLPVPERGPRRPAGRRDPLLRARLPQDRRAARSADVPAGRRRYERRGPRSARARARRGREDRKSTRLNSSH